ncbi:hypothetical protein TWF225_008512 [Orbilia oligospora]|nr:hypothetical protein TWF225_008512 [Orbilia oligospora]KAF3245760.1 hypothetical protein TWF217_010383 [Orbilia oligospora]KAF3249250.1 hypothetical protein TWF128_007920 [Orbilia oligospora]KAF3288929.1 hypothetical protein TWF132_007803 [Orbilia oligospora]
MLRFFPPFPSPNPATLQSPLENAPIVPSPPSSDSSSSLATSFSLSPPSTPSSPSSTPTSLTDQLPGNGTTGRSRSGSRSSARRCVPPRTRIIKRDSNPTSPTSPGPDNALNLASPPTTPPFNQSAKPGSPPINSGTNSQKQHHDHESEVARNKSVKNHHYEDAVRIACGAWCETSGKQQQPQEQQQQQQQQGKKKMVRWDADEE